MKYKEIQSMDQKSLNKKLEEIRKELIKENSQVASGTTPKNPGQLREKKKTIARIKTALRRSG